MEQIFELNAPSVEAELTPRLPDLSVVPFATTGFSAQLAQQTTLSFALPELPANSATSHSFANLERSPLETQPLVSLVLQVCTVHLRSLALRFLAQEVDIDLPRVLLPFPTACLLIQVTMRQETRPFKLLAKSVRTRTFPASGARPV